MSELCTQIFLNVSKNSVYTELKEGHFLRSLLSQIQNWKDKMAPTTNAVKFSSYMPRNHSFFSEASVLRVISGKHFRINLDCQSLVEGHWKNR